jgi:SAM-dependent methyltransferase
MGLARAAVNLMLWESARRPLGGSVVTLGRQHVYVTGDEVRAMARTHQVALQPVRDELHREPTLAAQGYLSDDCLLRMIGFERIVRVDYSDYEAPDAILDLNSHQTPPELTAAFDFVLDSGTIEHVFDIAAAIRHCARMVRPGGRVMHLTPSSNCVEHGFHSVSPTLFADFYRASRFEVDRVCLCRIPLDLPRGHWDVYDYLNSLRFIPLGQLDGQIWFTFAIATATADSVLATPQQWIYEKTWQATAQSGGSPVEPPDSKAGRLLQKLSGSPALQGVAERLIASWRGFREWTRVKSKTLPYPYLGRF